ncbi:MAG: hypothetical protein KAS94_00650 [Desulfobulbaceae bacterium]|nr:hypothetical protein [Desulfobulbaceae bacterium]
MAKRLCIFLMFSAMILLGSLFGGHQTTLAKQGKVLAPVEMEMSFADLESLEAEFHPTNGIVSVKGRLKNTSNSIIRGYLSLHLLSSSGSVLQTFELPVKDHQPVSRGESVKFEAVLPVSRIKGATQVSVDFTKN